MNSVFFQTVNAAEADHTNHLAVQGTHVPNPLTEQTGVWIATAGTEMVKPIASRYLVKTNDDWTFMIIEKGSAALAWEGEEIELNDSEAWVIPPNAQRVELECKTDCKVIWLRFRGTLAPTFLKQLGALLNVLMRQSVLPSQVYLATQIVQVIVRHDGTADASFQLQQLMWGLLASHSGQPVAMDAMLSHEIAKVVDALRASQYKENFSLQDMANISRMPMETFRKRFVSEVGMPPLNYLLYSKMERAKAMLQAHYSVKDAGAAVGMNDPYHFSKQFKKVVGISPSAYKKQAERE